ncbi:MAG: undecaprenyl-phosphate glucose phosphotransferase [Mariprofundaceae bacterium]|nr:undecaprenyl-phosphate glucose phosphotransferase [Mariprofundaceae bacterium]
MTKHLGVMQRHYFWLIWFQRLTDIACIYALLPGLCVVYGVTFNSPYQLAGMFAVLACWVSFGLVNLYRNWRGATLWREVRVILAGWLLVIFSLFLIAWLMKSTDSYSRVVIGSWFLLAPMGLILLHIVERIFLRLLRKRGRNSKSAIIVGSGELGVSLANRVADADWIGLNIVGFFDDKMDVKEINGIPLLGRCDDVYDYVCEHHIEHVYLALPMRAEKVMRKVFDEMQDTTASVFLIPDVFVFELMCSYQQDISGLPVFSLCESPLNGPFGVVKRAEDIVFSILILLLIWPVMLLIGIAIRLTSKGPALFKQRRYGLNGMPIKVYKFRSMAVCEDAGDVPQAKRGDVRITKFGAFLRRTSLDELPQFFNVLQGRMSIVGPRPHAVAHNEQYRKLIRGYMWRHKVRPGITGWAQINGWRGETDTVEKMEKRVEYDLDYIRRWSIWFDLKIILLTVVKGFINKNAY